MRVAALLLIGLTACAPGSAIAPKRGAVLSPEYAANYCDAKRGRLVREQVGKVQTLRCLISYADAGKACTDGAQCSGSRCLVESSEQPSTATTGTCAPDNSTFGCQIRVEAGVARTICID